MAQVLPLLAVVLLVGVVWVTLRRRSGVPRRTDDHLTSEELAALGADSPVLVLFTAPGCAPCGPARRILDEVGAAAGIPVISVDVGAYTALAQRHRVMRAPTTFVVTADGGIAARISGVPRIADLTGLLADAPIMQPRREDAAA